MLVNTIPVFCGEFQPTMKKSLKEINCQIMNGREDILLSCDRSRKCSEKMIDE